MKRGFDAPESFLMSSACGVSAGDKLVRMTYGLEK